MITPGEANPLLRRVYFMIYTDDGSALVTDGSAATTPPVGTIQVSLNGATFGNGGGSFAHINRAEYYYEATAGECTTAGFLGVKFERAGFRTELVTAQIGQLFSVGELDATKRRWPFTIYGTSMEPPTLATGATVTVASDLLTSLNGAAPGNAPGSLVEVGSGLYYYQGVAGDVAGAGTLSVQYLSTGFQVAVTTIDVAAAPVVVSPGGAAPTLSDFDPANGLDLGVDRNTAKFTPISFTVNNPDSDRFSVWIKLRNDIRGHVAYDSVVGFLPPFDNVASTFISGRMTVLQQAGWQDNVEGIFVGGRSDSAIVPIRPGGPGSDTPPDAP